MITCSSLKRTLSSKDLPAFKSDTIDPMSNYILNPLIFNYSRIVWCNLTILIIIYSIRSIWLLPTTMIVKVKIIKQKICSNLNIYNNNNSSKITGKKIIMKKKILMMRLFPLSPSRKTLPPSSPLTVSPNSNFKCNYSNRKNNNRKNNKNKSKK